MREHFLECISKGTFNPFPVGSQRSMRLQKKKEIIDIELHCYCRLHDDGSKMVVCESKLQKCKFGGWFQVKCTIATETK